MKINDFVEEIYFINLDRRNDRLIHIKNEFERNDIKATRFSGIDASKLNLKGDKEKIGAIGALRSHKGVIETALKRGQTKICIFEDDLIFCNDFSKRFDFYVENIPKNWDIMYLGCHFHGCKEPMYLGKNIYKVFECYGCFAMILNNERGLFNNILESIKTETKPIDNCINDDVLKNVNAYVFKPFFVKTLDTVSDIANNNESFCYNVVDKHYSDTFIPGEIPKIEPPIEINSKPEVNYVMRIENMQSYSNQYMCDDYIRSAYPFIILHNGRLIFDSDSTDKNNLQFYQEHFTLYGKVFTYQGMLIRRK